MGLGTGGRGEKNLNLITLTGTVGDLEHFLWDFFWNWKRLFFFNFKLKVSSAVVCFLALEIYFFSCGNQLMIACVLRSLFYIILIINTFSWHRRIGIEANEELRSIFKREVHLILQVRLKWFVYQVVGKYQELHLLCIPSVRVYRSPVSYTCTLISYVTYNGNTERSFQGGKWFLLVWLGDWSRSGRLQIC